MMWNWGPADNWAMSLFGLVMMLVFWGGLIAFIVVVVRMLTAGRPPRSDAALETLARRLATGEITPEEYQRIRKVLEP